MVLLHDVSLRYVRKMLKNKGVLKVPVKSPLPPHKIQETLPRGIFNNSLFPTNQEVNQV